MSFYLTRKNIYLIFIYSMLAILEHPQQDTNEKYVIKSLMVIIFTMFSFITYWIGLYGATMLIRRCSEPND